MNIEPVVHYATLISLFVGGFGLALALLIHRQQVTTQIFLALSARYDELQQTTPASVWLTLPADTPLPERTADLRMSVLRFCTLVSLTYFLFSEGRIPKRMWQLMLRSFEQRLRSPLFEREWETVRPEFESFPEFVTLVASVQQRGTPHRFLPLLP
jgi:hypothetical protein